MIQKTVEKVFVSLLMLAIYKRGGERERLSLQLTMGTDHTAAGAR
jgi:hypothetical protein